MKKILISVAALAALYTAAQAEPNRYEVTNGQSAVSQSDSFNTSTPFVSTVMLKKLAPDGLNQVNDDEIRRLDEKNGSHG